LAEIGLVSRYAFALRPAAMARTVRAERRNRRYSLRHAESRPIGKTSRRFSSATPSKPLKIGRASVYLKSLGKRYIEDWGNVVRQHKQGSQ
jgi:hypothetical protein